MKSATLLIAMVSLLMVSCAQRAPAGQTQIHKAVERTCVDLNTATAERLEELPGIGPVFARKIVEHRERHGPFRRPEEIMIINRLSVRKYRAIAGLICVE